MWKTKYGKSPAKAYSSRNSMGKNICISNMDPMNLKNEYISYLKKEKKEL